MVLAPLAGKFTSSTFLQHFSLQSAKLFTHVFCRSTFFEVDPKVSQILVHSATAPSTVAAGITLPAALLSRVQHNVCDFLGTTAICYPIVALLWLPLGCPMVFWSLDVCIVEDKQEQCSL